MLVVDEYDEHALWILRELYSCNHLTEPCIKLDKNHIRIEESDSFPKMMLGRATTKVNHFFIMSKVVFVLTKWSDKISSMH